jgi:hypothetical protein
MFIFESPLTNSSMEWSDCSITKGDVNYDGSLNVMDIVRIANYVLGTADFTEMQFYLADMNLDWEVNVADLLILANIILDQE